MKRPRDFIHIDEFWEADEHWPHYYLSNKVWVFVDEYRAELIGDESYFRIVIYSSEEAGWLYSRPLEEKQKVLPLLNDIALPVSEKQLEQLGFVRWYKSYI